MKTKILTVLGITATGILGSCSDDLLSYEQGDIKIRVEQGEEWLHDFKLFAGIKIKTPPQIAMWIEDPGGNYLTSIYVSHKIATESWQSNKGNRRKEALPVWCYVRGVQYPDGLYLPTKDEPLVDGISGATPHGSFDVKIRSVGELRQFVVKIEVNHSTDWNESYPEHAGQDASNYSAESGQPALVYAATVDLDSGKKQFVATLSGHASPAGTDGEIYPDTSFFTSALEIVREITINIQ